MVFAPYNFSYPRQDLDFQAAGLDPNNNRWCKVYDHSSSSGVHFSLLPTNQFKKVEKLFEGSGPAVNPVPIPQQYGGTLKTEIIPGASPVPLSMSLQSTNLAPPPPPKNEDNSPSETQKEIIEDAKIISIYYTPGQGYVMREDEVPAPFRFNELIPILDLFNEITRNYYTQWVEYVFGMFLAVIGFFVVLLIMSLLKMSSEWRVEAVGLFLVILIGSLIIILVIGFLSMRRYQKAWMDQITDVANQQNQEFFEGKKSKITAGLTVLTISLP
jgi:ABC-type multidrug transport system fused ATPase/permease subunit